MHKDMKVHKGGILNSNNYYVVRVARGPSHWIVDPISKASIQTIESSSIICVNIKFVYYT